MPELAVRRFLILSGLLLLAVAAAACSSEQTSRPNNATAPTTAPQARPAPPPALPDRAQLNQELFAILNRLIATEAGGEESPREAGDVASLLDRGADVNARNSAGQTPLILAAQNGHILSMRVLLDRGADINAQDDRGDSAIMIAANLSDLEMVKLLLARKAKVNLKDINGNTLWTNSEMIGGPGDARYIEMRRRLRQAGAR